MGSQVAAMLGNTAIGQCGPQNNDPILREQLGCPPLEAQPPAMPDPMAQEVATPGDPYAGAAPQGIGEFQTPGPVQALQGIPGAQLTPPQQLQANLGAGADKYRTMMGPTSQGGLPGYDQSQGGVLAMLGRLFGAG